jgi:hypothetical protein
LQPESTHGGAGGARAPASANDASDLQRRGHGMSSHGESVTNGTSGEGAASGAAAAAYSRSTSHSGPDALRGEPGLHARSLSLSRRNSIAPSLRASLEDSFGYNSPLSSIARQRTRSISVHDPMLLAGSVEPEALNERAVRVIQRVDNKLTGREFGEELSVSNQVQRLIEAATSHQNLCQCFGAIVGDRTWIQPCLRVPPPMPCCC